MSILRDEIAEQPAVLERLLGAGHDAIAALSSARPRFALIAARGSSDNVARYAQHVLGRLCGIPVALATPSLYTLYDSPPRLDGALVIGISQSGASPDVTAVVRNATDQGQATLAITNDTDSPMARAAGHVIALGTGEERSVAATKTYTASLAAVAALAAALNGDARLTAELRAAPGAVAEQLERAGRARRRDRRAVAALRGRRPRRQLRDRVRGGPEGQGADTHRRRAVLAAGPHARPGRGPGPRARGAGVRSARSDGAGRRRRRGGGRAPRGAVDRRLGRRRRRRCAWSRCPSG